MAVAACLYVRNEKRDIAEWLVYHHVVGFDTIIVFDNMSNDGTREVIRRASRLFDVRRFAWPWTFRFSQVAAYVLCVRMFARTFDWIAFIDADEFFVPTSAPTVGDFLAPLSEFSAIAVNYAFFGSNGVLDFPDGLVIDTFVRRAPDDFQPNHLVKSLVRPGLAKLRNVHAWNVRGRYGTPSGADVVWAEADATREPDFGGAQINHYFTRSRAHWDAKVRRGYRGPLTRRDEEFTAYDHNEVLDLSATRFSAAVKRRLERF